MNKKGFSLGELMTVIAVIGVIATLTLPIIHNAMPNKEQMLFKKAYYLSERIISEMVNDEDLYPDTTDNDGNTIQFLRSTSAVNYAGESVSGDTKFCNIFVKKMNIINDPVCANSTAFVDNTTPVGTVTTTDGMVWHLPRTTFGSNDAESINIDVNGTKGPNCAYNATTCKEPDRFTVNVYWDGRVNVTGVMEREYLNRAEIHKGAKMSGCSSNNGSSNN